MGTPNDTQSIVSDKDAGDFIVSDKLLMNMTKKIILKIHNQSGLVGCCNQTWPNNHMTPIHIISIIIRVLLYDGFSINRLLRFKSY